MSFHFYHNLERSSLLGTYNINCSIRKEMCLWKVILGVLYAISHCHAMGIWKAYLVYVGSKIHKDLMQTVRKQGLSDNCIHANCIPFKIDLIYIRKLFLILLNFILVFFYRRLFYAKLISFNRIQLIVF